LKYIFVNKVKVHGEKLKQLQKYYKKKGEAEEVESEAICKTPTRRRRHVAGSQS
jgi:hypothetical protein